MAKFPPDDEMPAGVDDIPPVADAPALDYGAPIGGDDEALRKIRRRTSPMGKVMTVVFILGTAGLGYWWYTGSQSYEHRWDWRAAAEAAPTDEARIAILREQL